MKKLFSSIGGGSLLIPALVALPVIFSILIGLGFTRNDIIEDDVYKIWAKEGSDYYKDRQYAQDVGGKASSSSLLASASSKDGKNILTETRLEEIRTRMEEMESVTVEHDGNEFTWEDICASNNIGLGTVYEFPCVRLTPMDLFQEARWFMSETDRVSWYNNGIKKLVVSPRIGRFGIMSQSCGNENQPCRALIGTRIAQDDALRLFSDLSGMEMNDPCRICVETAFDATMEQFTTGTQALFGVMTQQLQRTLGTLSAEANQDAAKIASITDLVTKVVNILGKINRAAMEEFFMYYATRGLYQQLGAESYIENYRAVNQGFGNQMTPLGDRIAAILAATGGTDLTIAEAMVAGIDLGAHVDSPFSSMNTAGNPFPIPGAGIQGGSGLDFSGELFDSFQYFDLEHIQDPPNWNPKFGPTGTDGSTGLVDPDDQFWVENVDTDPVYKWFMAGETKMTAHCGNDFVPAQMLISTWCTKFSLPLTDEERTAQHFAKMWYDLLIDSDGFLGLTQGEDDPYTWTNGQGCGYGLAGSRSTYTNKTESDILKAASEYLYFIDEGVSVGALEKALLMGGSTPSPIDLATASNPLTKVTSFQNIYPALIPEGVVDRVINFNRPNGPLNITEEDAEVVVEKFKVAMVDKWSTGWDDENAGEVQFTAFFDSIGVPGTFSFVLRDISDDSASLTLISVGLIVLVSMVFLASFNRVESRIGITFVGVLIVLLSFVGALGCAILSGIKINLNIAWTLPFIMIGLGVDDMYIVLNAMQNRAGNSKQDFVAAMKEIFVPVTMTSFVNGSMFLNIYFITDIGAIYNTALVALIAVAFLWVSIIFCYPAYCYLDMKRQAANRCDVLVCLKGNNQQDSSTSAPRDSILFVVYKRIFLSKNIFSTASQAIVVLGSIAFFVVGAYGISERKVGIGLQEFFPKTHQANRWAEIRNNDLASWPMAMSWGRVNYTKPDTQLRMMKQFEDVVNTTFVARTDTKWLWIADFNLWTTRQCLENFDPDDPSQKECGRDMMFVGDAADNGTACEGKWIENTIGLANKNIKSVLSDDECSPFEGGICRPSSEMFQEDLDAINATSSDGKSYCPIFDGWSELKLKFCVEKWREYTGGRGGILVEENTATPFKEDGVERGGEFISDDQIISPIPLSSSPTMYATNLYTHEDTVEMIRQTREFCDDAETHCFMTGIPFDFWEQYLTVDSVLLLLSVSSVGIGFVMATVFLFFMLDPASKEFGMKNKIIASLCGGILIAVTNILCLVPVIGISLLADVSLTAFSNMAFVLSVGFATEYSVHVIHRFLSAPTTIKSPTERVEYTMKFLAQPLTLSFLSSSTGVACLSFTDFDFNERFFFRPLMVVMVVTYFIGAFFLPILLTKLDFEVLKVGYRGEEAEASLAGKEEEFQDH